MEEYIKIEEYVKNGNDNNIATRRKSPLCGIIVMLCGIALLILSLKCTMGDTLKMTILTLGALAAITGLFMAVLSRTTGSCRMVYNPTGACIKHYRHYINADDRQQLREIINSGSFEKLGTIRKENSTCSLLHTYLSQDGQYALMQLEEYIPHSFEPITAVTAVPAEKVQHVQAFVK